MKYPKSKKDLITAEHQLNLKAELDLMLLCEKMDPAMAEPMRVAAAGGPEPGIRWSFVSKPLRAVRTVFLNAPCTPRVPSQEYLCAFPLPSCL
jgi:hypothetical protein